MMQILLSFEIGLPIDDQTVHSESIMDTNLTLREFYFDDTMIMHEMFGEDVSTVREHPKI
jgi:hypothetical protein